MQASEPRVRGGVITGGLLTQQVQLLAQLAPPVLLLMQLANPGADPTGTGEKSGSAANTSVFTCHWYPVLFEQLEVITGAGGTSIVTFSADNHPLTAG
jgi:hypothetical protein